jgi:hypothetical protein
MYAREACVHDFFIQRYLVTYQLDKAAITMRVTAKSIEQAIRKVYKLNTKSIRITNIVVL